MPPAASATRPRPGPTSSDGGSTTSQRLTRWPPPSTPCQPCGQARAGTRRRRSRPSAPDAAARPSNKGAPGGIRVSGQVRGAVQQKSWYLVSAQYLSNRSAPAPDPAAWDLTTTDGVRIEVKSAAYLQSWGQKGFSRISFNTPKTLAWDPDGGGYADIAQRQAQVYVFALLSHTDRATVNPLDLRQWTSMSSRQRYWTAVREVSTRSL